ncbi:hypothetical protein GNI_070670 [Gregarina niphandrodes]|uniref:Uncharacterized protein n=1 Tax=Gregarina niphandrodes TaxID=110365 RepID=A0A023B7C6_GRENI|nr:hypothetical protein GNI_070670 [Gregarina niphandrodes]EZG67202.1 hypothetical protein GNI_070670 [Gregarina niphandrodes]|eukprot:XP_011130308.1 hypothetical protein GNI_070670 [Gregarina niphandrodes]
MDLQPMDYIQVTLTPEGWDYLLTGTDEQVLCYALKFVHKIVNRQFTSAYAMMSAECSRMWPIHKLEETYNLMVQDLLSPQIDPCPITYMTQWHYMREDHIGWAYVPVTADGMVEAITMVVAEQPDRANLIPDTVDRITTPNGSIELLSNLPTTFCIDEVEFGRP